MRSKGTLFSNNFSFFKFSLVFCFSEENQPPPQLEKLKQSNNLEGTIQLGGRMVVFIISILLDASKLQNIR